MATIKFLIQTKSNPSTIYVRFLNGRNIDLKAKTNFLINPNDWDVKKGCVKNLKEAHNVKLQTQLNIFTANLIDNYNGTKDELDINWLKIFINPIEKKEVPNKLLDYIIYYINIRENELKKERITSIKVVYERLKRFEIFIKKSFSFYEINLDFKKQFENYLLSNKYNLNTIAATFRVIKTICKYAEFNDIKLNKEFNLIKPQFKESEKIYLDTNELLLVEKVELNKDYLDNVRDWLIISCDTGQRVSDFLRFKKDMIRVDGKNSFLEFTQTKTKKIMTIPLSKRVLSILKKRNGEFPKKISDQRYNEYIKEVCKLACITKKIKGSLAVVNNGIIRHENGAFEKWKLVSSHIGRRTFATNNYGRVPTSLLISATGHSTEKMFLAYIGKSNSEMAKELASYL